MNTLTADLVKSSARSLGADLVGIASAQRMNENPPDPRWPQTPERLWSECKSVVVVALHMPIGTYRAQNALVKRMTPHYVMNRLDQITLDLAYELEKRGAYAFPVPQQVTDTTLKRGTYGPISLRHAAVEAGLGTLGLNMMLVTPEYGPRVYLGAVMTNAELECDGLPQEAYCLGPQCSRCLVACPPDAVGHWQLNKPACATCAQKDGAAAFMGFLHKLVSAETAEEKFAVTHSLETVDVWQSLRSGLGGYAACPRCFEVCPVGTGYKEDLRRVHAKVEEATPDKRSRVLEMVADARRGDHGSLEHSSRWVGRTRLEDDQGPGTREPT